MNVRFKPQGSLASETGQIFPWRSCTLFAARCFSDEGWIYEIAIFEAENHVQRRHPCRVTPLHRNMRI
jgi:hypothetical protein